MRLEPGKYYRTRGGSKAYCLGKNPFAESDSLNFFVFVIDGGSIFGTLKSGRSTWHFEKPWDIIAEWTEE